MKNLIAHLRANVNNASAIQLLSDRLESGEYEVDGSNQSTAESPNTKAKPGEVSASEAAQPHGPAPLSGVAPVSGQGKAAGNTSDQGKAAGNPVAPMGTSDMPKR